MTQTVAPYLNSHGSWELNPHVTTDFLEVSAGLLCIMLPSIAQGQDDETRLRTFLDAGNKIFCDVLVEPEKFIGHVWLSSGADVANEVVRQLFKLLAHCGRQLRADLPDFDGMAENIAS